MCRFRKCFAMTLAVLSLVAGTGRADNLIVNGSFESGTYEIAGFDRVYPGENRIQGWVVGGVAVDWHVASEDPETCPMFTQAHMGPASDGSLIIDLNMDGLGTGWIEQTFETVPGQTYEVSFEMAASEWFANPRAVDVSVNHRTERFHMVGSQQYELIWERMSFTFVADSHTTTLRFSSPDEFGFWGPLLDDVQVHAADDIAPYVTRCQTITTMFGIRWIEFDFSESIDPHKGALDPATYRIESAGPDRCFGTGDDRTYPVRYVVTNDLATTWRVFPARPVPSNSPVRFTIFRDGIADLVGNSMAEDFVNVFRFGPWVRH